MEHLKGAAKNPLKGLFPLEEPSSVSMHITLVPKGLRFAERKNRISRSMRKEKDRERKSLKI